MKAAKSIHASLVTRFARNRTPRRATYSAETPLFASPASPARHGLAAAARLALKENDPAECIPHQPATQSRFALACRALALTSSFFRQPNRPVCPCSEKRVEIKWGTEGRQCANALGTLTEGNGCYGRRKIDLRFHDELD